MEVPEVRPLLHVVFEILPFPLGKSIAEAL
jgi:hypothetical protein